MRPTYTFSPTGRWSYKTPAILRWLLPWRTKYLLEKSRILVQDGAEYLETKWFEATMDEVVDFGSDFVESEDVES